MYIHMNSAIELYSLLLLLCVYPVLTVITSVNGHTPNEMFIDLLMAN